MYFDYHTFAFMKHSLIGLRVLFFLLLIDPYPKKWGRREEVTSSQIKWLGMMIKE
jgi:hypothetical protein